MGPPPSKGSEIFVGRVPRDAFEYELVKLHAGLVVNFMITVSGNFDAFCSNRFAIFSKRHHQDSFFQTLLHLSQNRQYFCQKRLQNLNIRP
jgi:hypothetical protein